MCACVDAECWCCGATADVRALVYAARNRRSYAFIFFVWYEHGIFIRAWHASDVHHVHQWWSWIRGECLSLCFDLARTMECEDTVAGSNNSNVIYYLAAWRVIEFLGDVLMIDFLDKSTSELCITSYMYRCERMASCMHACHLSHHSYSQTRTAAISYCFHVECGIVALCWSSFGRELPRRQSLVARYVAALLERMCIADTARSL